MPFRSAGENPGPNLRCMAAPQDDLLKAAAGGVLRAGPEGRSVL